MSRTSRLPRSGSAASQGRRPATPRRGGFRIDDRILLASVLLVLAVSLIVFAGLIVSGASRLGGGGDGDDAARVGAHAPVVVPGGASSPAVVAPPPIPTTVVSTPAARANEDSPVVCLDVGHGGVDEGKLLLNEAETEILAMEKDFTLSQALALRDRLRAQGVGVVLTRETDTEVNASFEDVNSDGDFSEDEDGDGEILPRYGDYVDELDELQARVNVCNGAGADLLISIHINGADNLELKGYEAWYADGTPYTDESARIASLVTEQLGAEFRAAGYETIFRGAAPDSALDLPEEDRDPDDFQHFVMLSPDVPGRNYVGAKMPSIVVECLFLSNEDDAAFLVDEPDLAQNAIVTAYESAILEYFADELAADTPATNPTPAPRPAPTRTPAAAPDAAASAAADAARSSLPAPLPDTGGGRAQVHYYGDSGRQEIAFTFDLGSDRGYTEEILDFLKERGIRASFGLTGKWAEENPDLVRRIADEGHQLFNHTYSHSSFTGASPGTEPLTREERIEEIEQTHQIVMDLTGHDMRPYFRLPYGDGADDPQVQADIYAADYYLTIMWTCDSYGWKQWTAAEIIQHCYSEANPGGIILMHVGSDGTDQLALPGLVDELAADGYEFVTIAEVLAPQQTGDDAANADD